MTLKDVLDVLAHYDVQKMDFPNNFFEDTKCDLGYCDHQTGKIYIDKNTSVMQKKLVLLHELVHAWLHLQGIKDKERDVNTITKSLFKEMYETY